MSNGVSFQPLSQPLVAGQELDKTADIDPRLTRTHYFDGRLLTAEDLTRDQIYLDQRLREVGQVIGTGVMNGLETFLDTGQSLIKVKPGIGVTSAGRVLELTREVTVDLGKRALISQLNDGLYRRFNRGLYVVVLSYAEVRTDVAEVFPKDLGEKRTFQYDVITEGVQLGLVPLLQPLAEAHEFYIRSNLIRHYLGDELAGGSVPEDAVALGVLAIARDRPIWFDSELLRHPLRAELEAGDLQKDLSRQYEALYDDVLTHRSSASMNLEFAASEYFQLLPPVGSIPKDALSPAEGRQVYFPENYRVWVAPIRQAELALVKKESMPLPPMDLSIKEPVDVIVLAPLSNADYGYLASRLERDYDPESRRLPYLDLMRLRLYKRRPVHELDTDQVTWQMIWDRVNTSSVVYIRRPTRAAETAISGIMLARGTELPEPVQPTLPSPGDEGGLVVDEDDVFLGRINLERLGALRPPASDNSEGLSGLAEMQSEFGDDAQSVMNCASVLILVESKYDVVLWQTLILVARNGTLAQFTEQLWKQKMDGVATGAAVVSASSGMFNNAPLKSRWTSLDSM